MTIINQIWERLDRGARIGLVVALVILAAAIVVLSAWLLRPNYQVLFSDLAPADAAAMTAELDKMKTPYHLDNGGATILVAGEDVYKTRLKLVGRDLPLHGTIGFELFNNSDIGMTEFAQKVNYQRALQGELTRTILSYEEIQSARVHLAIPEQSLFKKENASAKASVSLTLKPGKILQPREVQGIQRLVAASVPDIKEQDVTVIDQHGVALTRQVSNDNNGSDNGSSNLDSKEAFEHYLTQKVTDVLDRTFGAGQSIASVDVVLNFDAVKTTTENVLGANDNAPVGVITHEHQTGRAAPQAEPAPGAEGAAPAAMTSGQNRDVDYQVGRRVEQVVSGVGTVDKINIAVVVRQQLDDVQIEKIRDIVAMAAGIDKSRGDGIAVYTMAQFGASQNTAVVAAGANIALPDQAATLKQSPNADETRTTSTNSPSRPVIYVLAAALAVVVILLILRTGSGTRKSEQLSTQEREALLGKLRVWLETAPNKHGDVA